MVIRKVSKTDSKYNSKKEEDSYEKRESAREQKRELEKERKKQQELEAEEERLRQEEIVMDYLDNLKEQIDKKDSWSFWTFPDRSGFKKLKNMDSKKMQKLIHEDLDKYKNRRVVSFGIADIHRNTSPTSQRNQFGTMLAVKLRVWTINDDGSFSKRPRDNWGADFTWEVEDFKTTKFSFKLLERIMEPVAAKKITCVSLTGYPIAALIKDLKKLKYDLSDILNPLAGL